MALTKRGCGFSAVVLFAGGILAALLTPNDWQRANPFVTGRLYVSDQTGNPLLHYMTEEPRTQRFRSWRKTRDWFSQQYTRYRLETRSALTGEFIQTRAIADVFDAVSGNGPSILGATTDTLWIFNAGLEMRDSRSLALRVSNDELRARNENLATVLPTEHRYYRVSSAHGTLVFKGTDTEYYEVENENGLISRTNDEPMKQLSYNGDADDGFSKLPIMGEAAYHTSPNSFLVNAFLTRTGVWYALLTKQEREQLSQWPGKGDRPWGEVARDLYKTTYEFDDRNEVVIDPRMVEEVGSAQLIQSGFLIRGPGAVWDVPSPSSTLVLCRDRIGKDEPWQVARLARDGRIIYKASTGLSDFDQLADAGSHLVFFGRTLADDNSIRANERMAILDSNSGEVAIIDVANNEVQVQDRPLPAEDIHQ